MSKKYAWAYYEDAERVEIVDSIEEAIAEAEENNEGYYDFVFVWEAKEAPYWKFDARSHFWSEELFSPEDQSCPLEDDWISYWGASEEQLQQLNEYVAQTIQGWKEKHFPRNSFYYTDKFIGKIGLEVDTEALKCVDSTVRLENEDSN